MMRVVSLLIAAVFGIVLLYISRFWMFSLWTRDGLFGLKELRPNGGLLARWLRGTDFSAFELIIWAVLVFLTLTYLQRFMDLLQKNK